HAVPQDWPEGLDIFGTSAPLEALRAELLETASWQPSLVIGDDSHGDKIVNDDGTVAERAGGGGVGGFAGGLGGAFGGGFGGGGDTDSGEFTALWLEFEVRTPSRAVTVERRQVFDLVGPAMRHAGGVGFAPDERSRLARAVALAGETEIDLRSARAHPA